MSIPSIPGKNVEVPEIPFRDKVVLPAKRLPQSLPFVQAGGRLCLQAGMVPGSVYGAPGERRREDASMSVLRHRCHT